MLKRYISHPYEENTYLLYHPQTKDAVIFDPGDLSKEMEDFIEEQAIHVRAIVLTHSHGDHILGVPYYKDKYQVDVYAHEDEQELLEDAQKNLSIHFTQNGVELKDVHFVKDQQEFELGSIKLKCIHTPGHTKGSCLYKTQEDGIITGDTIFRLGMGRYDLYSGNFQAIKHSILEVIYKLEEDALHPGHGGSTTVEYEKHNNPHFRVGDR